MRCALLSLASSLLATSCALDRSGLVASDGAAGADRDCGQVTVVLYRDSDGDGRGDPSVTMSGCVGTLGYVTVAGDCDDGCASCWTGASEVCDGFDNDCDPLTPDLETYFRDADGDGFGDDSMSVGACEPPPGHTARSGDCDDTCPACNSSAAEICDGLDNDCAGGVDDGFVSCACRRARNLGHEYLFCGGDYTQASARALCVAAGLDLVVVGDATEQAWLAAREDMFLLDEWYLGLVRAGVAQFQWIDGTVLGPSSYTNWRPAKPDGTGDCVRAFADGFWGDTNCANTFPSAVCESR